MVVCALQTRQLLWLLRNMWFPLIIFTVHLHKKLFHSQLPLRARPAAHVLLANTALALWVDGVTSEGSADGESAEHSLKKLALEARCVKKEGGGGKLAC